MEIDETEPELKFVFSERILEKLQDKHDGVTKSEVIECFDNSDDRTLEDTREEHKTIPPTQWFISETNRGRQLKICFVFDEDENTVYVITAYKHNSEEIRIFEKYA